MSSIWKPITQLLRYTTEAFTRTGWPSAGLALIVAVALFTGCEVTPPDPGNGVEAAEAVEVAAVAARPVLEIAWVAIPMRRC
jgi:hypothetical protein